MNAALLDISFFCFLFNVTHLSLGTSREKRESSKHIFAHERQADSANKAVSFFLCTKLLVNSDHTAFRSMIKRFDIIEPHVAVFCAPRLDSVILREDCLGHRAPFRSESDRSVPRVEFQVNGQLVCARTVGSRSNVHAKVSSLVLSLCFCEEQIQYPLAPSPSPLECPLSKNKFPMNGHLCDKFRLGL